MDCKAEAAESFRGDVKPLLRYMAPYWSYQFLVLLIALVSALIGLAGPFITRVTIDYAFGRRDILVFNVLVLLGGAVYLFQGAIGLINRLVSTFIGTRLTFMLRRDYVRLLFRLSYSQIDRRSTGEQLFRLGSDIDAIAALATSVVPQLLSTCLRVVCLVAVCLWLHWPLAVIILALAPLFYLHSRWFAVRQAAQTREIKTAGQEVMGLIQDRMAHVRLVKQMGLESGTVRDYLARRVGLIRRALGLTRLDAVSTITAGAAGTIATTLIAYYLGRRVIEQTMTLGTLVALMLYLTQLLGAITGLAGIYRSTRIKWVSWTRVLETLRMEPDPDGRLPARNTMPRGALTLRGVTFGYAAGQPVLSEIDLAVDAGRFIGLAGPSGSGKTTLLMLLCRLLKPWQGTIGLDGIPLSTLRSDYLHRAMGIAMQDGALLNLSIRENLLLGADHLPDERLWWALDVAGLRSLVESYPQGLDTSVGEAGRHVSEGQRQRLSLARAIAPRPCVLLLDEVTAAVGYDLEANIIARLRAELPDTTIVFASHRLLSIRDADRIVVLDAGRIIGNGNHDRLLETCAVYERLYRAAARGGTPHAS